MKTLTVITTTYNRAYCLHQVYESLLRQKSNDFLWLIVDDGSTDNTSELVDSWKSENKIEIEYYYKPNGGMHTARNYAYDRAKTELCVIIDSDDWMTDNAVESIIRFWNQNKSEKFAGIISDNITPEGEMVGPPLPDIHDCKQSDLKEKYGIKADKKLIYRTDLIKKNLYPEFPGEKFFPASYKFMLLDDEYTMLIMHEYTCVVNYGEDSMTYQKAKQYRQNAEGFAFYRNFIISRTNKPKVIIREMIHYIAESMFAKKRIVKNSSKPFYSILCYPWGIMYYFWLNRKLSKEEK